MEEILKDNHLAFEGTFGAGSILSRAKKNRLLFIERNKVVVNFSDIKEVFYENKLYPDAVIVLYSGDGIPIKGKNNKKDEKSCL